MDNDPHRQPYAVNQGVDFTAQVADDLVLDG